MPRRRSRRRHRRAGWLALAASAAWGCAAEPPPNLVLIVIDTLRADRLGAYGFAAETSPELDAYARRGVRFDFAVAQNTWTRPSMGSMLTSRYPRSLGIYNELEEILPDRFETLAETLRRHDYTTLGATANPNINSSFNFHRGFDRYLDSDVVMEWMEARPGEGVRGQGDRWLAPAREILDAVREQLDQVGEPPYYLQITLMDVHEFHDPRAPLDPEVAELFPEEGDARSRRYLQRIRIASREVDRFIRSLEAQPAWANTLFVVTSDHGETLGGDHPGLADPKWHGYLVYESQARVPLLLYSSSGGLPEGRVIARPVRLLDLMPTLLDYAGVPVPDGVEGVSLLPLLRDPEAPVGLPEVLVVETRFREARKLAAYTADWTYVENADAHPGTRPRELHPRGAPEDGARTDRSAAAAAEAARLAAQLRRWEAGHPSAAPTRAERPLPHETVRQLRAIGYLD